MRGGVYLVSNLFIYLFIYLLIEPAHAHGAPPPKLMVVQVDLALAWTVMTSLTSALKSQVTTRIFVLVR